MIKRYSTNDIDTLAVLLKHDGVISVPTDTVYDLCAIVDSKNAYDKLIEVKNRPLNKSFPIMCADEKQIKKIANVSDTAQKIIQNFMPGPITIILKKKDLPDYATNGKTTVAIRMATTEAIKELIIKTGSPLFMTSANQSGEKECSSLDEIEQACPLLDGMLEGNVSYALASTIVDCTTSEIKILREGPISLAQIKEVINK